MSSAIFRRISSNSVRRSGPAQGCSGPAKAGHYDRTPVWRPALAGPRAASREERAARSEINPAKIARKCPITTRIMRSR